MISARQTEESKQKEIYHSQLENLVSNISLLFSLFREIRYSHFADLLKINNCNRIGILFAGDESTRQDHCKCSRFDKHIWRKINSKFHQKK